MIDVNGIIEYYWFLAYWESSVRIDVFLRSPKDALDSASSMFVHVTPASVLAREKKIAEEKKKKEERAKYCSGVAIQKSSYHIFKSVVE